MINRVALVGILNEKGELSLTKKKNYVLEFVVRVRERLFSGEERSYVSVSCLAFGKVATIIANEAELGSFLTLDGSLMRAFKKTTTKQGTLQVLVESVYIGKKIDAFVGATLQHDEDKKDLLSKSKQN